MMERKVTLRSNGSRNEETAMPGYFNVNSASIDPREPSPEHIRLHQLSRLKSTLRADEVPGH